MSAISIQDYPILSNNELMFIKKVGDNKNSLINHLKNEDGSLRELLFQFIDEDGDEGEFYSVDITSLEDFISDYAGEYIVFRDSIDNHPLLFEVSDGLLCYVTQELPIKRCDVRSVLYHSGLKSPI